MATFLALAMSILSAHAQFTTIFNTSGGVSISGYTGTATAVVIPDTINGYRVTEIGKEAFKNKSIQSVTMPESTFRIGDSAFENCQYLTKFNLPQNLYSIGTNAFWNCSQIWTVTLNSGLYEMGPGAFGGCSRLTSITAYAGSTVFSSVDGVLFNYSKTTIIQFPPGKYSYTIPVGVTTIGDEAFAGTSLTGITFPASVTTIGQLAFYSTNMASVTIPATVTSIGYGAFMDNYPLKSVSVASRNIGDRAFYDCVQFTSLTLSEGVETIGDAAFMYTHVKSLTLPSTVTTIGEEAFWDTDLTTVMIPAKVYSIGSEAFGCPLLTSIEVSPQNYAYVSVSGVLLTSDRSSILQYPSARAATSYVVPEGVQTIEPYAFDDSYLLTRITLPSSLKTIGNYAFTSCPKLTSALFKGDAPQMGYPVFDYTNKVKVSFYKGAQGFTTPIWTDSSGVTHNSVALTLPPVITSSLASTGTYGKNFNYTLTASNSPTKLQATGLPTGLSFTASTGKITGTLAHAGTYPITLSATNSSGTVTATLNLTVLQASQRIAVTAIPTQSFGTEPFPVTATATSGFRVGIKVISGPARISGGLVTLTGAGVVTLAFNQGGGVNYTAAPEVLKNLKVSKGGQTITFPVLAAMKAGSQVTLTATASSGLPVTYTISGPATLSGKTLTTTGKGNVTVKATQPGNPNYNAAARVTQVLVVK